ncbi:UDP-galactose-lipid carrier transferase [Oceanicaulis sp. HTCC2633]|uniref:exopolysaccharide biosynthesis polyprenyl glycosylphosphotransferase n=1 Tax=Oceanicaulis sp. HTCC2633 TaxID=314254 RepID=UPI000066A1F3|nr:exopolysaccharide biosynthesis polyprenyl glycosylphosphotransferase [Oceanicaulis sp. HTCC2633]EAP90035.1 UDP-galactose-lipid carrier transferase [Oceanicaulis sp. HTCC2633]
MSSRIEAQAPSFAAARTARKINPLQVFVLSDMSAISLSGILLQGLHALTAHPQASGELAVFFVSGVLLMGWFNAQGHYRTRQPVMGAAGAVLKACALACIAQIAGLAAYGALDQAWPLAVSWMSVLCLVLALRVGVRALFTATGGWLEPVTVLAPQALTLSPDSVLSHHQGHGLRAERSLGLEPFGQLSEAALHEQVEALSRRPVFLAPDADTQAIAARLARLLTAHGARFYYRPAMGVLSNEALDTVAFPPEDGLILSLHDSLDRPFAQALKRGFDIAASLGALIFLSPLLACLLFAIRRDGGPAFFSQKRLGAQGKVFGCLKFRTMVVDAEAKLEAILASDPEREAQWRAYQKLDDDPRITAVGKFLRMSSLDELPQLINVLKGDMSLVGPRPMTLDQQEPYGEALLEYQRVRPGLTGLWQVNGRNETTFDERARLDRYYVHNWSLWRDAVILVRTVREVLFSSGR